MRTTPTARKNLTVGRDKLTVLGHSYDIVEIDTLSFKDHDVFSVKFPSIGNYSSYYLNSKSLDSVSLSMPVTRERRYDDKLGYSDRISGYPARVSVSVNQYHRARTINGSEVTESEYDDLKWEKHEFYWSTDEQLRLIHLCD